MARESERPQEELDELISQAIEGYDSLIPPEVREGKQSMNWERYKDLQKPLSPILHVPCTEGFPHTPRAYNGGLYELVSWSAARFIARVDYSNQYRADGLGWDVVKGPFRAPSESIIVAWNEYEPPKNPPKK